MHGESELARGTGDRWETMIDNCLGPGGTRALATALGRVARHDLPLRNDDERVSALKRVDGYFSSESTLC
jgi:hypothetical protein